MQILRNCGSYLNSISRVFRVSPYSTETGASNDLREFLQSRVSLIMDSRTSIIPTLEEWRKEGRSVKKQELHKLIRVLRTYKRFSHALETCEWMREKSCFELSPSDVALELDLISKVRGIEQAEKRFNETPDSMRSFHVYGALLNCYTQVKSLEKAEAIMQKMRDMKCVNLLSCNSMLGLYYRLGKHEKLDSLIQEMEEDGIIWDRITYSIRLSAYVATSDIEGMEKLLTKLETDSSANSDWNVYTVLANGYLKADLKEKAVKMLKKSEQFITGRSRKFGYEVLLTLYASMGNKTEVYRVWNLYKQIGKFFNTCYIAMVSSLLKLDDMDVAENIFEEWMSGYKFFDFRVPNLLIGAYCKRGLLEKAEKLVSRAMEKGNKPISVTWDHLAAGYHKNNQMEKAVESMKKALLASSPRWKPNPLTLGACLEFLKLKGDVEEAENLVMLLREHSRLPADVSDRLIKYIRSKQPGSNTIAETLWGHEDPDAETDGALDLEQESLN